MKLITIRRMAIKLFDRNCMALFLITSVHGCFPDLRWVTTVRISASVVKLYYSEVLLTMLETRVISQVQPVKGSVYTDIRAFSKSKVCEEFSVVFVFQ